VDENDQLGRPPHVKRMEEKIRVAYSINDRRCSGRLRGLGGVHLQVSPPKTWLERAKDGLVAQHPRKKVRGMLLKGVRAETLIRLYIKVFFIRKGGGPH